ncbi:MAG: hypothetical protein WB562_12425, partial [Candidatus Sulfotelmatobacter sp.]
MRPPKPIPAPLSRGLQDKLLGYTSAATAAGVGILALAQPSQAKIVYTPANEVLNPETAFRLDLNHDGIIDFTITNIRGSSGHGGFISASASFQAGNAFLISGVSYYAAALPPGRRVGLGEPWKPSSVFLNACNSRNGSTYMRGPWNNVKDRHLALRFLVEGKTHFGWARLSVSVKPMGCKIKAVLTGYAYESVPE